MSRFPYRVINIVGAPGSGTSTLGRVLADRLGFHHADGDDFYWKSDSPPFQEKIDPSLRLKTLLDALAPFDGVVVSGSVCGWGEELEEAFDLVIFLSLPTALRLQRIEQREIARFGHADPDFLAWAAQYEEGRLPGRSRARHEAWLARRSCRLLRIDGDYTVEERLHRILALADAPR